ncbi:rep protein [Mycobacterium avium]|uniref:rep protein n=1 Tax=Mycobacterium avium TaxID=1764 RepID=UPI001F3290C2|nr:rep protein [Mycobacterium avium]
MLRAGANTAGHRAPMWTSRAAWLDGLRRWAQSPALGELCAEQRVSMTAATLLAIAAVMAEHADHATGRHVAVTRATIADTVGCDVRTVTAAWRVLRVSRWAVEAQRGHGSPTTPSVGRRPSVYHLVPRRDPQPAAGKPVHDFHLPPSGGDGLLTPVGSNSPSVRARAHATGREQKPDPPRRWRTSPRPLATQRLAAQLVARTHGLGRGHIGGICDALTAAGIDPTVWSARAITDALDADMRTRGCSWPDDITNPAAFLSSRLRRLSWTTPPAPPKGGGYAATRIDQTRPRTTLTDAAQARIAAAREHIRQVLTDRARRPRPERTPRARSHAPRSSIVESMATPSTPNEPEQAIAPSTAVRRWRREECTVHADAEAFFRHLDRLVNDDVPSGSETAR